PGSAASSAPRRGEDPSPVVRGGFHLDRYVASSRDFFGGATPPSGPSEERHGAVIADRREVAARTDRCSALDHLEIANEPARRREANRRHLGEGISTASFPMIKLPLYPRRAVD